MPSSYALSMTPDGGVTVAGSDGSIVAKAISGDINGDPAACEIGGLFELDVAPASQTSFEIHCGLSKSVTMSLRIDASDLRSLSAGTTLPADATLVLTKTSYDGQTASCEYHFARSATVMVTSATGGAATGSPPVTTDFERGAHVDVEIDRSALDAATPMHCYPVPALPLLSPDVDLVSVSAIVNLTLRSASFEADPCP